MRRFFLATVIATLAFSVRADWELVGLNDSNVRVYVDPDTIKIMGDIRRAWTLTNRPMDEDGSSSSRLLTEYDCTDERMRYLSISRFSEPFARGQLMQSFDGQGSWSYVAPQTVGKAELDFVCNYKKR